MEIHSSSPNPTQNLACSPVNKLNKLNRISWSLAPCTEQTINVLEDGVGVGMVEKLHDPWPHLPGELSNGAVGGDSGLNGRMVPEAHLHQGTTGVANLKTCLGKGLDLALVMQEPSRSSLHPIPCQVHGRVVRRVAQLLLRSCMLCLHPAFRDWNEGESCTPLTGQRHICQ